MGRRVPQQDRSRARFEAILDAAAALIDERGLDLTAAAVIERAGTSTGTFYAYFDDVDAVVDALVDRHLAAFVELIHTAFAEHTFTDVEQVGDVLLDAFAAYYRQAPGYHAIWHGGGLRHGHRVADRRNDQQLVATNAALLVEHGLVDEVTDGFLEHLRVNWVIGDALLLDAFAADPDGDPSVIEAAKQVIRLRTRDAARHHP